MKNLSAKINSEEYVGVEYLAQIERSHNSLQTALADFSKEQEEA